MKAFGFKKYFPIEDENSFIEFEADEPNLQASDVLVKIEAIAINPVDIVLRKQTTKELIEPRIVGFDGVGRVVKQGSDAHKFKLNDKVYFSGSKLRSGSYAEFVAVAEDICAIAPKKISTSQAAALPLTSLTAYESLVDKLHIDLMADNSDKTVLIINGSGGVGSIATQLAKMANMKVISTASAKNKSWVEDFGADIVVDHHQDLVAQLKDKKIDTVDYILVFTAVDPHWEEIVQLIKPFGKIVAITSVNSNLNDLKEKSVDFKWEYMFTKTIFNVNAATQGKYLANIAEWVDSGRIKTTLSQELSGLTLANIKKGTELVEQGKVHGKLVIKK